MLWNDYSAEDWINAIQMHPVSNTLGFEKTLLGKELDSFIKWRYQKIKPEMIDKLFQKGIYDRVYKILEDIKSILDSKDESPLEVVHAYEKAYSLLSQLNNISRMRFLTSLARSKPKGSEKEYEYVTMNFYTGFSVQPKYAKRNYRILNSLSEYQDPKDPQIAIDAEKKYFDECLDQFDKLEKMPIEEFLKTIK